MVTLKELAFRPIIICWN